MRLNLEAIKNKKFVEKGYKLPLFDIEQVKKNTKETPEWVHFGAGNIFRAFPAKMHQQLLNEGKAKTGIVVAEGFDYEIIDKVFKPYDQLTLSVVLKANGTIEKEVIASMVEGLKFDPQFKEDFQRLTEVFENESLQIASFTITEKGYELQNNQGEYYPNVLHDFKEGHENPTSYLGKVVYLLHKRYLKNQKPLTLVSMDNYSHNGTKLRNSILDIANHWLENKLVHKDFVTYLENQVAYPWSMIDKITPRPDGLVANMLKEDGFLDVETFVTNRNTYIAPYVNAEEAQYLVIEDHFKNGRPQLEEAGVIFTDKETVDKVEKMKVCTCLNPLHTGLAIYGCILGYDKISEQMKDPTLVSMIKRIGYTEGLPVVVNPGIIDPKAFIDEVIEVRLPNPFMPDTPQRIATDTSQKLSIRFGETIKAYLNSETLKVKDLKAIPLVLAGWIRYLMGIQDNGKTFEVSPDPLYGHVHEYVKTIKLGDKIKLDQIRPLLEDEKIFGINLVTAGLAETVVSYFNELNEETYAVRKTLDKYLL